MAYEPTEWKTGDVVTSAKLNKLEEAVAGMSPLVVTVGDNDTLSKKWSVIWEAFSAGRTVVIYSQEAVPPMYNAALATLVTVVGEDEGKYGVVTAQGETFSTESADGYPEYSDDPFEPTRK